MDWEDCSAIDRLMHETFSQDEEDYALTVSSAGLDRPFKVYKQYLKAVGANVDVKFKGGKRIIAVLSAATEDSITIRYSAKESVEGSKKKVMVEHEETYGLAEINSVRPYIEFT